MCLGADMYECSRRRKVERKGLQIVVSVIGSLFDERQTGGFFLPSFFYTVVVVGLSHVYGAESVGLTPRTP